MEKFSTYGLIGRSGTFYPCRRTEHIETQMKHLSDFPFVYCADDFVEFEAYFTSSHSKPNKKQFDTLCDWCTYFGMKIEDVLIIDDPWLDFLG